MIPGPHDSWTRYFRSYLRTGFCAEIPTTGGGSGIDVSAEGRKGEQDEVFRHHFMARRDMCRQLGIVLMFSGGT